MPKGDQNALHLMLGDETQHARFSIWLWLYLQYHEGADFAPEGCSSPEMQGATSGYLETRSDIVVGDITAKMVRLLVKDEHLAWISNEDRQTRWLLPRLEEITNLSELGALPNLLGRDLLVGMIDLWDEDLTKKIKQLQWLHDDWLRHKALDQQFKWFEERKEGTDRCKFAWNWIQKNEKQLLFRRPHLFGNHQELLVFFDATDLRERERKDIVQSIRQSWNRQKYLERLEGKKQYNFILSNKIIDLLDALAEANGLKRPQVLEMLVKAEARQGAYLPERLKLSD